MCFHAKQSLRAPQRSSTTTGHKRRRSNLMITKLASLRSNEIKRDAPMCVRVGACSRSLSAGRIRCPRAEHSIVWTRVYCRLWLAAACRRVVVSSVILWCRRRCRRWCCCFADIRQRISPSSQRLRNVCALCAHLVLPIRSDLRLTKLYVAN